jgi:hypothetical protein
MLDCLRDVIAKENDWQSEAEKRRGVTQPPGEAQDSGAPGAVSLAGKNESRHGGKVVGVCGVTKAQQERQNEGHCT